MLTKAALTAETLAAVLSQSSDCVKLLDLHGELIWMNSSGQVLMEVDDLGRLHGVQWAAQWPADYAAAVKQALDLADAGNTGHFRAPCPTLKGNHRWWDVSISGVSDVVGKLVGYLVISRDVTQNERDREAMATMVDEMRHRLRNSYALVCSLMNGHARHDETRSQFAREMSDRIMALAAAQSLFEDGRKRTELAALVDALVEPFAGELLEELLVDVPAGIMVDKRTADAIALVIGELAVNSVKYGAAGRGGSLRIRAENDGGQIRIVWLECHDGREPAPVANSSSSGQGLSIIRRIVASRLGTFTADVCENGISASLMLPLIGPAGLSAQD